MTQQIITAFFDEHSSATAAVQKLENLGIPRNNINLYCGAESGSYQRSERACDPERDEGGFWAALRDLFIPEEDRYTYAEGMSRGGCTVSVTAEEGNSARIMDVLEQSGAVDLNEREAAWKREGWSGYTAANAGARTQSGTAAAGRGTSEAIPIVEEQLKIGKRVLDHGRVRVRSYVREVPIEDQVTLREEKVRVERRPVDRPVSDLKDPSLFRDRTVEVEEHEEEAVIAKEARVKEEVLVKKDVEQRTQMVKDKVRRTEVEVEDERTGREPQPRPATKGSAR